jgi:uncharacterized membrane protein YphA (DoxX/SURF4 family)
MGWRIFQPSEWKGKPRDELRLADRPVRLRSSSAPGIWASGDCHGKGTVTHTACGHFEIVAADSLDQLMHALLILQGAQAPNVALTLNRVALGAFFAIGGYHKLFNASRHSAVTGTLREDGVHALPIMQWVLPSAEFGGGCALILGLLSVLAAFGLFVICVGAIALDAVKRIRAWQPIDRADWLDDLLYLPETLYCVGLTVVMLAGPGAWSVDARIAAFLAG